MAVVDINTLKQWFVRGAKPLQTQFAAWMDSYWHKEESIPPSTIEGLQGLLDGKVDIEQIENIVSMVQYERRLNFTVQSELHTMLISEPMTIYKADYTGLDKLEISTDNGATWQTLALGTTNINIDSRKIITFRFTYSSLGTEAYIYLFAKVKTQ